MKPKRNVLASLSVFIVVVFVLTLFGQQPQRGALWDEINDLKSRVTELEAIVSGIQLGAPDYDSGWQTIPQGGTIILDHMLGSQDVFVYMIGQHEFDYKIHHIGYGMFNDGSQYWGAYWKTYLNHIWITRPSGDWYWDKVRVRIWKLDS